MAKSEFPHRHIFRVRWSDTDSQGIVCNSRILDYADVAITEYFRASGMFEAMKTKPFGTHSTAATINWVKPIKPDEKIEVMARTSRTGNSSMTQTIEIHGSREDDRDDLRAQVDMVYVHVDLETHISSPLPEWVKQKFQDFDATAPSRGKPESADKRELA